MSVDNPTENVVAVPRALTGNPAIDLAPPTVAQAPVPQSPPSSDANVAQGAPPVPAAGDAGVAVPVASVAPVVDSEAPVDPTPPTIAPVSTPSSTPVDPAPSVQSSLEGDVSEVDRFLHSALGQVVQTVQTLTQRIEVLESMVNDPVIAAIMKAIKSL